MKGLLDKPVGFQVDEWVWLKGHVGQDRCQALPRPELPGQKDFGPADLAQPGAHGGIPDASECPTRDPPTHNDDRPGLWVDAAGVVLCGDAPEPIDASNTDCQNRLPPQASAGQKAQLYLSRLYGDLLGLLAI